MYSDYCAGPLYLSPAAPWAAPFFAPDTSQKLKIKGKEQKKDEMNQWERHPSRDLSCLGPEARRISSESKIGTYFGWGAGGNLHEKIKAPRALNFVTRKERITPQGPQTKVTYAKKITAFRALNCCTRKAKNALWGPWGRVGLWICSR